MTEIAAKGLHAKLAEVMAEAERIPKNGTAPQNMGGYKFVQVGDAADVIRKALAVRGVSMLPSAVEVMSESEHETRSGGTMTTQTVRTTWTLVDGETGQAATIQSLGTGADAGDKFSPKAQTNAMKYALLMGFLLSTGDDPELGDTSDRGRRRDGAPVVGSAVPPAPPLAAGEERLTHRGQITRVGTVVKGGGRHSDLAARQVPDGLHIGFRLELEDDKAIPQVVATGPLGQELLNVCGDSGNLVGMLVEVTGDLFEVRVPQRAMVHRLVATRIAAPDWTIPGAQPVQDAPHADLEAVMEANGVTNDGACGHVAADGLMTGAVCILTPDHAGAHKSADGSWPR